MNYKPKNGKEKEEINKVLMQVNDILENRDKITDAFKDSTFLSEYLKKSDDAGYKYVLRCKNIYQRNFINVRKN